MVVAVLVRTRLIISLETNYLELSRRVRCRLLIGFQFALDLELELQAVRFDVNKWRSSVRL